MKRNKENGNDFCLNFFILHPKYHMRKPNCNCARCGKSIYRRPFELERKKKVYCSPTCWRAEITLWATCKECKKEFQPGKKGVNFCSRACANRGRRGLIYKKRLLPNPSQVKLKVLKDKFDFKTCMIEGCQYDVLFDIHRFVGGRDGGKYEIGNMFAICPNHHAEITRGHIQVDKVSDCQLRKV